MAQSTTSLAELKVAVDTDPYNVQLRGVYADALEEAGKQRQSAHQRNLARKLASPLPQKQLAELETKLAAANGKRRERTLPLSECLDVCRRAHVKGYAWIGTDNVANSYGYKAVQTGFVVARNRKGGLRFAVGVVNATKGTSVTNGLIGLTKRATDADYRSWADSGLAPRRQPVIRETITTVVEDAAPAGWRFPLAVIEVA